MRIIRIHCLVLLAVAGLTAVASHHGCAAETATAAEKSVPSIDAKQRHDATVGKYKAQCRDSDVCKAKPAFYPLPPGEVRPTGWLLDWSKAAAEGITGHLDERATTFSEAWKGKSFKARGVRRQGTGWPLEQCAYWLDGLVRLGYILDDPALIAKARDRLDLVVDGVHEGGETLVYWRPKSEVEDAGGRRPQFNSWSHHHMARALLGYYQATADPRILEALVRVYRDYPLADLPDNFGRVTGATNLDPMLETYILSGEKEILEQCLAAADREGFRKVTQQWNAGEVPPGHNVIFYENVRLPGQLYPWTANKQHLDATFGALEWQDQHHWLPLGVCSGEEWTAGIGSTRNTETCNVPCSMWTFEGLLRSTGDGLIGDRIEQVFFNAGPGPIARDFQTMCYYQSPNRLSTELPRDEPLKLKGIYRFTPIGYPVLCCVGNSNRILPFYIEHMWTATPDDGLAAVLYGPCRLESFVGDGVPVTIDCQTNYPFEETIRMAVDPEKPVSFPLRLRIPEWAANPSITLNGENVAVEPDEDGFVTLSREWKPGDKLQLTFPMTPWIERGRETPVPRVRYFTRKMKREMYKLEDIDNPYASVSYGPLLFALPIPDVDANQVAEGAEWHYALDTARLDAGTAIDVVRHEMPDHWRWQLDTPVRLKVPVRRFDWKPTPLQPLPAEPVTGGEPMTVELVPYGCTKFRVSMFPVTNKEHEEQ